MTAIILLKHLCTRQRKRKGVQEHVQSSNRSAPIWREAGREEREKEREERESEISMEVWDELYWYGMHTCCKRYTALVEKNYRNSSSTSAPRERERERELIATINTFCVGLLARLVLVLYYAFHSIVGCTESLPCCRSYPVLVEHSCFDYHKLLKHLCM